jgi:fumarate hydratase, class I
MINSSETTTNLFSSIMSLIELTSSELPSDVALVLDASKKNELEKSSSAYALNIIEENRLLAKKYVAPLCQDTGTISFYVNHPKEFDRSSFEKICKDAVLQSTEKGILRQNSVDSLSGKNSGNNLGLGHPGFYYEENTQNLLEIKLMLKGGGCENVGAQYSLPDTNLCAGRDLSGVNKVVLDCVKKAQGQGCSPGILGVCIGGDRATGYAHSKKQLLRFLDDKNPVAELQKLEEEILCDSNQLGIGPMGFGGKTTLLGVKISTLHRLPASFFVSISYMCWAHRRQGIILDREMKITKWIYR